MTFIATFPPEMKDLIQSIHLFEKLTRLRWLGLFVVGSGGNDARISELENLDMISGWLRIQNLKYIKDPADCKKASLKKKKNMTYQELNKTWMC